MTNNKYNAEFKVKAVELLRGSGKSQMQLAKELGVAQSSLYKYSRQYDSGVFTQAHRKPPSSSYQEIARLTAELRKKSLEVENLKNATAFFAK